MAHPFLPPAGDTLFSDDFFHSLSLCFASLTSLHESGRFDAPFSCNELVAALSKCHESALALQSLSHGGVILCFPSPSWSCNSLWYRPLGQVVPVIKRDGDPACGQTLNNNGLLSVWFNDEDCLAYVRDTYFLNQ